MNLLMVAPLCDSRGVVRYNIGAQVDVSGLVKECAELQSFQRLLELQARGESPPEHHKPNPEKNDELRELSEMLNQNELATIRKYGGRMHRESRDEDEESVASHQPRLLIKDPNAVTPPISTGASGRLSGIYQHVRHSSLHESSELTLAVSSCPPTSFPAHLVCVSIPACARRVTIALHEQDRRL
jgi:hypothetical protein